jgi:IS1 family transposase
MFRCLAEGNSVRATSRLCDVAFNTALKFIPMLGSVCAEYQDQAFRNLNCRRLQLDEIWSFCKTKQKFVRAKDKGKGWGDVWTWIALDADTRLIPSWHVGKREFSDAATFVNDLASRLAHRVQLTTDGHNAYLSAIENAFGDEIDYAMLVKLYGPAQEGPQTRYSPPACIGTRKTTVTGNPDKAHVSTSYIEAQNLGLRMHNRRFTRLTNAYSRKLENHRHALAITMMHHNFCKIHSSLRVTPAMEAGITDHVWEPEEVVALTYRKAEWAA